MRPRGVRLLAGLGLAVLAVAAAGRTLAHAGGIRGAGAESLAVPAWLFLATGGGVVGVSFLLASFVTDRTFVARIDTWGRRLPSPGRAGAMTGRLLGLIALGLVFLGGLLGPPDPLANTATLVVWVGWWSGLVGLTYLVGNAWPVVDPFRTLARVVPSLERPYPERWGAWPSVIGLLVLVWLEVVTPLADDPRLLARLVAVYALVGLAGTVVFGADTWFGTVDPITRLLRYYGAVAPVTTASDGLRLRLPGMGLTDPGLVEGRDEVAFVIAMLFTTTYDGFVGTDLWAGAVRSLVDTGVPALLGYAAAYLLGYLGFLVGFAAAARLARRYGETFLTADALAARFAPSLLAIAAGYHLAHNLNTVLGLAPVFARVIAAPLAPPFVAPAPVPGWVGGVAIVGVLAGHLLAVWVAHATAYDLFPDRLQAVRSQYGVTAAMVVYTMISLWIVTSPSGVPPYV